MSDFLKNLYRFAVGNFGSDSRIHGPNHWLRVERNAIMLAQRVTGADLLVCRSFALLHDCCRHEDGPDQEHGPRAAQLVMACEKMLPWWELSHSQTRILAYTCRTHTVAKPHRGDAHDITCHVCYDADRLDFGRIGVWPDPAYLFTHRAKHLAVDLMHFGDKETFDWDQLKDQTTYPEAWEDTPIPEDDDA